jgi:hypothetical protein
LRDEPQLLCAGALVGKRSEWLWTLQFAGGQTLMMLTTLVGTFFVLCFLGFSIYQDQYSAEARLRHDYFTRYLTSDGSRPCSPVTLRAERKEIHKGEIRRNMNGMAGALMLNRSLSIDELLKRQVVFICVEVEASRIKP